MKRVATLILIVIILCPTASATEWEIPEDAYGIWYVPDLNFYCPVYEAQTWRDWQPIVDAEHSMLINSYMNARCIADHCCSEGQDGKGYWYVQNIELLSAAYLIKHDETLKYECYMTAVAIPDPWGYLVNGVPIQPTSSLDILCRCCVGMDASRNFIAMFRLVKKI